MRHGCRRRGDDWSSWEGADFLAVVVGRTTSREEYDSGETAELGERLRSSSCDRDWSECPNWISNTFVQSSVIEGEEKRTVTRVNMRNDRRKKSENTYDLGSTQLSSDQRVSTIQMK